MRIGGCRQKTFCFPFAARLVQGRVQGRPFVPGRCIGYIGTENLLASFGRHHGDNFLGPIFNCEKKYECMARAKKTPTAKRK